MEIVLWIMLAFFILFLWNVLTTARAHYKRDRLLDNIHNSGDQGLALAEFGKVPYNTHYWRCYFLRSPKNLYGPLIQGIWQARGKLPLPRTYDALWWKCYHHIYLKSNREIQQHINQHLCWEAMGFKPNLPYTLIQLEYDLTRWLPQEDPPPKFSMAEGAEEYEMAMQAQELMP